MSVIIRGGEQYLVPVVLMEDENEITDEDVSKCMIQINGFVSEYPDGSLTYSKDDKAWMFPLEESMSYSFATTVKIQAKYMVEENIYASESKGIIFDEGIIKKRWVRKSHD